ncbi:serine hydrolase [Leptolyngbya sp. KIOST-1]|uniref:serine hydrolase n=1 Tax=Leptolyngbya sp. KIOST-1 TaxID=1229172 RepID=UPI000A9D35A9|nr:serine hydrolase [Leptolyngbya sp. KIOST-1]
MAGFTVTHVVLPKFPVAAPERGPTPIAPLPPVETLTDLYHLRDRLNREIHQSSAVMVATRSGVGIVPEAALEQRWAIDRHLQQEEAARRLWHRARTAAVAAAALGDPTTLPEPALAMAHRHWDTAIAALEQVPPETLGARRATAQRQAYEQQRAIAAYHYDTARSEFLRPIVAQAGPAARVRLTVCNLRRDCRRWQGNQPPAHPASLIKVPVAIALVSHLHEAGLDPATPLWVDPGNWTEDAGTIWVRTEYPVAQIMADMISASGNIATNQLIDYLGWDGLSQSLRRRGYGVTRISTKLVGQSTYPANPGQGPNAITTDELTDMMVAIYNREVPYAGLIQAALAEQRDRRLGHAAVHPPTLWLGEKTGRNSQVLGTTMAVRVGGQPYIITATLDHSADEAALRGIVAQVIQHLSAHGGFGPGTEASEAVGRPSSPMARPRTFLFQDPKTEG